MTLQYHNGSEWVTWTKSEQWPNVDVWRVLNSDGVPMVKGTYDECEAYHDRMNRTLYRWDR
jgi:hypothetical protein